MMGLKNDMIRCLSILILVLCACSCSTLPERISLPAEEALLPGASTRLDALIGPAEQHKEDQSGFRLVEHGPEALALRVHSTALADRSIDVQTYIWTADLTGRFLANELLLAADRGVRVRLLLDDLDARANNYGLASLAAHPNIAVRLFNPAASRSGSWSLIGDLLSDGRRLNRRMHNKAWIVDNRIALAGGRNLGNEYFGASDGSNYVDLELLMVGPVVRDASRSFDRYWNDVASYPISLLSPEEVNDQGLESTREALARAARNALSSEYAALVTEHNAVRRLMAGEWSMVWLDAYRFIADDPSKIRQKPSAAQSRVLAELAPALDAADHSIRIISPYFVPREGGTNQLVGHAERIDHVSILTNSLAANDVIAVHGAYSKYRKDLLRGGVELWELKPDPEETEEASWIGGSRASLHTKALSADGDRLFVGSYNLDPRSTSLNCEQGIFLVSTELTTQFDQMFDRLVGGEHAWSVSLRSGRLVWKDGQRTYDKEPEATVGQRFQAGLMRWLPIKSQL